MKAVFIWLYIVGTKIHETNYPSNDIYYHKNHTRRRGGTPQNFCLAFVDKLEKQLFIKKLLKWANKKYKYFNIYKNFKNNKKIKKNTWSNHFFIPVHQQSL